VGLNKCIHQRCREKTSVSRDKVLLSFLHEILGAIVVSIIHVKGKDKVVPMLN
jgi:hypothetical protein